MTSHLPPEVLVAFLDGTLDEPNERHAAAHLQACGECARQLAELRSFDEFVAPAAAGRNEAGTAMTEAAMFDVARRVLAQGPANDHTARAGPRRPGWLAPMLLAAVALLAATLYATFFVHPNEAGVGMRVRRYAPTETMRGATHRFHLELDVPAPRWLAVFAREADGGATQLFPSPNPALADLATPLPLAAGSRRVPAEEMLDWEFDSTRPPSALWIVPMGAAPAAADLAVIRTALAAAPDAGVPPGLQQRFTEARHLPFPRRP